MDIRCHTGPLAIVLHHLEILCFRLQPPFWYDSSDVDGLMWNQEAGTTYCYYYGDNIRHLEWDFVSSAYMINRREPLRVLVMHTFKEASYLLLFPTEVLGRFSHCMLMACF